jgi:hypothetical protein
MHATSKKTHGISLALVILHPNSKNIHKLVLTSKPPSSKKRNPLKSTKTA